jgi:hypothetical protein
MSKLTSRAVAISSFLLLCAFPAHAQKAPQDLKGSCLHFTQEFYTWYVKTLSVFESDHSKNAKDPELAALNYEGKPFTHELDQGLRKVKAEEKASGDAILDFDPFLNSQDPAEHYEVRKVTEKNGHYWAEVYGVWSTQPSDLGNGPQVVAEMAFENNRWVFVNFHYPNSTDPRNESLLRMLRYALHTSSESRYASPRIKSSFVSRLFTTRNFAPSTSTSAARVREL